MKRKLVFATNNAHKLDEISAILGEKVELLSLKDIHCDIDIPETSDTLEGNAMLKAEYIYEHYGLDCFADDTGLEVEALNGEPGVYSARYAGGEGHNAEANMQKLLQNMQGIQNRKAQTPVSGMILSLCLKDMSKRLPNWEMRRRIKSAIVHWRWKSFAGF